MGAVSVLYIEDEPRVAAPVKTWLEENGFVVELAPDGAVGRFLAQSNPYDLVLLDVNLPFVDGYEVCRDIRAAQPELPIIMVTALGNVDQKLKGFDAGADDYMVKPFDFRELLARMKALLKRKAAASRPEEAAPDGSLVVADLVIDVINHTVHRAGQPIALTTKEFTLLEFLVRKGGKVASRQEIIEHVWDIHFDTGTNVVEVYINFLRKKIDRQFETKLIHTKPGMGYYLKNGPL
jgi:DNA-binding response OmpR family regulator